MSKAKKFFEEWNKDLNASLILTVICYTLGLMLLVGGFYIWAPIALVGLLFLSIGLFITFGPFIFF